MDYFITVTNEHTNYQKQKELAIGAIKQALFRKLSKPNLLFVEIAMEGQEQGPN
jgi:hypothetical protein